MNKNIRDIMINDLFNNNLIKKFNIIYMMENNNSVETVEDSYKIKNKETGETFDVRIKEDMERLNLTLQKFDKFNKNDDYDFWEDYIDKLKVKLYHACDIGNTDIVRNLLDKNKSDDRIPNVNEKYSNNYTVLHKAVHNGLLFFLI